MKLSRFLTLQRCNDALSVVIVAMALYIFLLPFIPAIVWWIGHSAPVISTPAVTTVQPLGSIAIPKDNTLAIPSLDVYEAILEGQSVSTVDRGIWRRPQTSTPDKGSNTVLVGHRFAYGPTKPFYNLDKVKVGDEIAVYWQGKAYKYKVQVIKIVPPQESSVEEPTNDSILTLYTCTPLWTAKSRLVVQATLVEHT